MPFIFFDSTGKALTLEQKSPKINTVPMLCSVKSTFLPYLIERVVHVFPTFRYLTDKTTKGEFIALFSSVKSETIDPSVKGKICLVLTNYNKMEETNPIIKEYKKCILPMILCKDINGYYISSEYQDTCFFSENTSQTGPHVKQTLESATCYIKEATKLGESIYLNV